MSNDPTSWRDVALALTGAPIGAVITVAGVMLTNRSNRKSQERQLQAQFEQQRQALDHDLRGEHQRRVLSARADLYAELLRICDAADGFGGWVGAAEEDPSIAEPDNDNFFRDVLKPLRDQRGRVAVY